ncbi:Lutropin-choriogonadotropic hormone receptor [Nymphon striatum]|nr:Lutropin-choriogonadotropic hormone receptor [Nymphon striatum]
MELLPDNRFLNFQNPNRIKRLRKNSIKVEANNVLTLCEQKLWTAQWGNSTTIGLVRLIPHSNVSFNNTNMPANSKLFSFIKLESACETLTHTCIYYNIAGLSDYSIIYNLKLRDENLLRSRPEKRQTNVRTKAQTDYSILVYEIMSVFFFCFRTFTNTIISITTTRFIRTNQNLLEALVTFDTNVFQQSASSQLSSMPPLQSLVSEVIYNNFDFARAAYYTIHIPYLDMSRTSITSLPTDGLQDVEVLRLQQTYSLHTFPSIYNFKYIKKALLTYPYHCCSFRFPAKHDPREYEKFQRFKEDIQKKHCAVNETSTENIGNSCNSCDVNLKLKKHSKKIGDVSTYVYRNAFNPCEDIMGNLGLRIAVWFVVVAAVLGNFLVFVVLLSSRFKMTVAKFLMCNLACADFFMGTYLFPFSLLQLFTFERWFAITYAIDMNKRIRIKGAAKAMLAGWMYALTMATLPVLGISGYARTSICLPMVNEDTADLVYLITLLSINGLAFILICGCYAKMYVSITAQHCTVTQNDKTVAKRMALLVFTDFACWAPIAFFGLTAVAGHPLIDVTRSKILLVFFYPLNSCANPFLYAILTKQYKRDLFILLSRYGFCTKRAMKYKTKFSYMTAQKNVMGNNSVNTNRSSVNNTTQLTLYDLSKTFKGLDSPRRSSRNCTSNQMLPDLKELYGTKRDCKRNAASSSYADNHTRAKPRGSPHPLKNSNVVLESDDQDVVNCLLSEMHSPCKNNGRKEMIFFKASKKTAKNKQRHNNVVKLKI